MPRNLALALALIFTTISAAYAGGTDFETIYNPNEPYPSGQEQQSVNSLVLQPDFGRREQLHFDQTQKFESFDPRG